MRYQPNEIIRRARGIMGYNQSDFANSIQRSQGEVSKYETGKVVPPTEIIIRCMNIIEKDEASGAPTLEMLMNELSLSRIGAPEYFWVRKAIMGILTEVR